MKTKKTLLKYNLYIWAVPNCLYGEFEGEEPFNYSVTTFDSHYHESAALCYTSSDLEIFLPKGVDLTSKLVDSLYDQKAKLQEEYYVAKAELEDKISSLLAIEYKGEE